MLDRADTWEPNSASGGSPGKQDSADQFKIKSKGAMNLASLARMLKQHMLPGTSQQWRPAPCSCCVGSPQAGSLLCGHHLNGR